MFTAINYADKFSYELQILETNWDDEHIKFSEVHFQLKISLKNLNKNE